MASTNNAALLLLRIRQIAMDELNNGNCAHVAEYDAPRNFFPGTDANPQLNGDHTMHVIEASPVIGESKMLNGRFRTVSLCSMSEFDQSRLTEDSKEIPTLPLVDGRCSPDGVVRYLIKQDDEYRSSIFEGRSDSSVSSVLTAPETCYETSCIGTPIPNSPSSEKIILTKTVSHKLHSSSEVHEIKDYELSPCISKFVGNRIKSDIKVRDCLRKKFSWKSFPELERYLIDNRMQYLEYSNQLNYTAEQKRYNNQLTQGLLDLAAKEGYLFEGFTFPAVRDRIRCYYKSYVQATKKKKLKVKRHSIK